MKVRIGGHVSEVGAGETVLDALLRDGFPAPHACKAGVCGSCMMRVVDGPAPEASQAGLDPARRALGYLLTCVCRPTAELTLAPPDESERRLARVAAIDWLAPDVVRARLEVDGAFEFRPGQYVTVTREGGPTRSYSVASLPAHGPLELHIRRIPGGRMSGWFADQARPGDEVRVTGPFGGCFYLDGRPTQPLLLVGAGTGLAPLYGILRDALGRGHTGPVRLFHGAVRPAGLYLRDELRALEAAHPNFSYTPAALESAEPGVEQAAVDQLALARVPDLDGWRGFLCGDPALVGKLQKRFYLAGMPLADIHADAFLPSS